MTAHQQSKVNQLRQEHKALTLRSASPCVLADCYDAAPATDSVPVVTYRIAPTGAVEKEEK